MTDSPAAPDRAVLDGIISDVERVADVKMWRTLNGELLWRGATPDGNEIETEPPRVLLASALGALRALRDQGSPDYSTQAETAPGMIRNALQILEAHAVLIPANRALTLYEAGVAVRDLLEDSVAVARLLRAALAKLDGASGPPNPERTQP